MRTTLILVLFCVSCGRIHAQNKAADFAVFPSPAMTNGVSDGVTLPKPAPTTRILPADIEQDSIQLIRFSTNLFAVRWTYTEAGAKKALAAWEADPKHHAMSEEWKTGWLKHRTDKGFFDSESAAAEFMKGIKSK